MFSFLSSSSSCVRKYILMYKKIYTWQIVWFNNWQSFVFLCFIILKTATKKLKKQIITTLEYEKKLTRSDEWIEKEGFNSNTIQIHMFSLFSNSFSNKLFVEFISYFFFGVVFFLLRFGIGFPTSFRFTPNVFKILLFASSTASLCAYSTAISFLALS